MCAHASVQTALTRLACLERAQRRCAAGFVMNNLTSVVHWKSGKQHNVTLLGRMRAAMAYARAVHCPSNASLVCMSRGHVSSWARLYPKTAAASGKFTADIARGLHGKRASCRGGCTPGNVTSCCLLYTSPSPRDS